MKKMMVLALSLSLVLMGSTALAFHDGGVADCAGCHTMHNSQDNADVGSTGSFENLLLHANATETCLSCHADYGQFYGGAGYGPGGDFYWVTKTFSWSAHGHTYSSTGDSHGHNVVAPSYGISADATLSTAPGGDFIADRLSCTSCHDPHGRETFRILYDDRGDGPRYDGTRYDFANPAPQAVGNSRRTMVGQGNETNVQHTVYKDGMADWCANCHTTFHEDNTTEFVHPVRALGGQVAGNYNAYVSTEDPVGGNSATAYWGLVPFEDVSADLATVDPTNYTDGPASNDQVMCLSCHRAHASAFSDIGRWDFGATLINDDSHPQLTDTGATADDVANKYYQYTFVDNQRSLCNKCHVKDRFDHLPYEVTVAP